MDAVLGIDIGKAKFHITLLFSDGTRRRKACANTAAGCTELFAWLTRHGARRVHASLEATGTYRERVALTLVDAGHQVSLLNPAIIHHYAKSRLARAKTDAVDVRELQALVRRLDALLGIQTDERNRAQAGGLTAATRLTACCSTSRRRSRRCASRSGSTSISTPACAPSATC